jgi:anaerobic selenocysteine-containing dehydrogenase
VKRLPRRALDLLHQRRGILTEELERARVGFGLGQLPNRLVPDATTTSVCGFCSTGCGLTIHLKQGRAINLSPARQYPVNLGTACPKGWEALAPLEASDRAKMPLLRNERNQLTEVSWRAALETFTRRMQEILRRHGPESVAFIGTGQTTTEELALLGALTKFGMGLIHGDANTRQCMATSVVAYKQSFGFDAPPYTYRDFEESDVIVLWGSNLCIAHPIMWERVCRNPHRPEIIVVDPRKTETASAATQHVPLKPKSDLTLLYGLARLLIEAGAVDREFVERHTSGFEAFAAHVADYDLERVARVTELSAATIERMADAIRRGKRVSFWWTMGVNQSHEAVLVAQGLINLALITGNIGRPGTGANSITGQCNAMGSRLFSNTTSLMGGHDLENPEHRKKVARVLDIDAERIPKKPSLAYDQIMESVLSGKIKALWVIGTNTAHSWINQADALTLLDRLEFLVVQDMYFSTETARRAHLVLPAAGWGEKEGTFINSERRIGRVKKVARAPGQALADFYIFKLIAEFWGVAHLFERWTDPEAAFRILCELTRGQPCDISGITDYAMIDRSGGIQWPLPEGGDIGSGERRLFEDGRFYHPDGKARLICGAPRDAPEQPDERYPFVLLTGRGSSSQWHTQTRTGKSEVLRKLAPRHPYVEMSPVDAERLKLSPNQWVIVESRRGKMKAKLHVTHVVRPKQLFVPMHYPETNQLTFAAFDPDSRQPSYKYCAARVRRIEAAD